jgi:hypothetical protein
MTPWVFLFTTSQDALVCLKHNILTIQLEINATEVKHIQPKNIWDKNQ